MNELAESRAVITSRCRPRRWVGGASTTRRILVIVFVGLAMARHGRFVRAVTKEPAIVRNLCAVQSIRTFALSTAPAQEMLPAHKSLTSPVADDVPATDQTTAINAADDGERRRNMASILMMLLAGVGLIGVAMIAAAMIWAAKLRRLARASAPGPTQQDELWYLKTPPPPEEGGSSPSPSLSGDLPNLPTTDEETST